MKIRSFMLVCLFTGLSALVMAQPRKSVDDRVAAVREMFQSNFRFDAAKLNQIEEIFTSFYMVQERIRGNIQSTPSSGLVQGFAAQDFQSVRKSNENNITERDNKLRKLLSSDEFKKWQEEIEPALRNPRRRP